MADDSRIEDLRRRLRKDPASIAFAQLAEELRQAKQYEEAVAVCRTGLALYPAYLSARVTLGRCLIALDQLDEAQRELDRVHDSAPENLAAVRALAEIRDRRPGADTAPSEPTGGAEHDRALRTVTALEAWLAAIHVARASRSA